MTRRKGPPADMGASVRARLTDRARKRGEDVQRTLTRFAIERLLYRLSVSEHRAQFVLKGAMLFSLWSPEPYRGTGDLDLLGYGDAAPQHIAQVFRGLCEVEVPDDGVTFDPDTVRAEIARADEEYSGVRITLTATIAVAELPIQIDIGFGDVVTPGVAEAVYPSLLDLPEARLRAYPPETVIAEKLEALVSLGVRNTRMKDFYDLWAIANTFAFDGATLARAVSATFERRQTPFPDGPPFGLTAAFSGAPDKQALWRAFLARTTINRAPAPLAELIDFIAAFALPLLAPTSVDDLAGRDWAAGGPWQAAAPTKSSAAPTSGEG